MGWGDRVLQGLSNGGQQYQTYRQMLAGKLRLTGTNEVAQDADSTSQAV